MGRLPAGRGALHKEGAIRSARCRYQVRDQIRRETNPAACGVSRAQTRERLASFRHKAAYTPSARVAGRGSSMPLG